ncbi:MAG: hypothetical protein ACKOUD_02635 [Rhodoluna sp.]
MRLLIFIAVILGIALIFGVVYGISALLERKRSKPGSARTKTTKTLAPDDDPAFLRDLARRLAEDEAKNKPEDEPKND